MVVIFLFFCLLLCTSNIIIFLINYHIFSIFFIIFSFFACSSLYLLNGYQQLFLVFLIKFYWCLYIMVIVTFLSAICFSPIYDIIYYIFIF